MNRAIFLDRDGVIIENRADYVRSWDDVSLIPGALRSLQDLARSPFWIVVVTNQSVVGRGLISLEQAREINDRLIDSIVKAGGRIDALYMCPHAPEEMCNCRKPMPGLLQQAEADLSIDLSESIMIGDAATDLIAAWTAGIKELILVRTGRGDAQIKTVEKTGLPFTPYASLADAIASLCDG